jgi:hypothetical protein
VLAAVNADTVGRKELHEHVVIELGRLVGGEAAEADQQRDGLFWQEVADNAHAVGRDLIMHAAIRTDGIPWGKHLKEMIAQIVGIFGSIATQALGVGHLPFLFSFLNGEFEPSQGIRVC